MLGIGGKRLAVGSTLEAEAAIAIAALPKAETKRLNSKGAAEGDRIVSWGYHGRGVRPARPRMTGPVIPT
jgi:hypothetical protein